MESHLEWHSARALLEWQVELGVTEAISDMPVNRYAAAAEAVAAAASGAALPHPSVAEDPVDMARKSAAAAQVLSLIHIYEPTTPS